MKHHYTEKRGSTLKSVAKKRGNDATRDRILTAATQLFARNGYHNTQVMDIVNAIGMSAGTFYNYFQDKRDVFAQASINNVHNLRLTLVRLRNSGDPEDLINGIAMIIDGFNVCADFVDNYPDQFLMMIRGCYGVDEDLDDAAIAGGLDLVEHLPRFHDANRGVHFDLVAFLDEVGLARPFGCVESSVERGVNSRA